MKVFTALGMLAALALAPTADAASGKGKPGYCDTDKNCPKTYTCVSVQTTRDGVTYVKQCLPTAAGQPVCTGINPGLCPSFSTTWGKEFRQISSVCAYIQPEGKVKCIGSATGKTTTSKSGSSAGEVGGEAASGSGTSTTGTSTKGGVECIMIDDKDEKAKVGVIYGCVDFDGSRLLFKKGSKSDKLASQIDYADVITKACKNPKNPAGASFVCSSQGTCAPKAAGQLDYECKCNIGFQGKYCEKIVNNKCYNDGVCGGGSCDTTTNECTKCPPGTTGNKCAQCDPAYDASKVCNGKGKCVAGSGESTLGAAEGSTGGSAAASNSTRRLAASNQCQCVEGYSGATCDLKVAGKQPETAGSAPDASTPAPSSASAVVASVSAIALTLAAAWSA